jgi:3-phenylpropionate/trans-cinnamate dioxygenase ferredoxin reductase subunit
MVPTCTLGWAATMATDETFVIVGAALAGAKAAETLRMEGFDGRVVLVGEEHVRPYERPPLSKEYLRGEKGFDHAAVHAAGFYEDQQVELLTGAHVVKLDPAAHEVELSTGERVGYTKLLLCTGCAPRRLQVPGADLPGVFYLRTVEDSDALRQALSGSPRVVVIGAGWIGSEVAASARQMGAEVSLVELASSPLEKVLGRELGEVFASLHSDHGVKLHLGKGVESLAGAGRLEEVRLSDGTVLPADVAVVGIGAQPRTELAEGCGLAVADGIVSDEHLATSAPDIYAAGDVASVYYPRYKAHIRLEHWAAALNQGPAAARSMLGRATPYDETPYFYSDQYDFGMEYRGWAPRFDQVVFRGDKAARVFISFWLQDGVPVAAMNANIWDAGDAIEALLRAAPRVGTDRLADGSVPLEELARTH